MDREEILERSRKENKNQDVYEQDVILRGNRYACMASGLLAVVFAVVQVFLGLGMSYGLFAVALAMPMAGFWMKYVKLRRKHELVAALGYTAAVAMFSVAHVAELLAASAIL